jgi:hypothetical protein
MVGVRAPSVVDANDVGDCCKGDWAVGSCDCIEELAVLPFMVGLIRISNVQVRGCVLQLVASKHCQRRTRMNTITVTHKSLPW